MGSLNLTIITTASLTKGPLKEALDPCAPLAVCVLQFAGGRIA